MESTGRAGWVVFLTGAGAYGIAVMHRATLGVASLEAADHFHVSTSMISLLAIVQLASYAAAQIPAGVALDRFGSRALLTTGILIVAAAQLWMATSTSIEMAFASRILIGLGDACIFNSAVRLVPRWFPARQVPMVTQLTGLVGQTGQILSVYAALPLIQGLGWRDGLAVASAACVVAAAGVAVFVRNAPKGQELVLPRDRLREIPRRLADVVRHPATMLGFWVHFTAGFSLATFTAMWGMPYLRIGQGLSQGTASLLFTVLAVCSMLGAPIVGVLTSRHPLRRSTLALLLIWATLIAWIAVLAWPGRAPILLLLALMACLGFSGPATGIGFDFPRTELDNRRLGSSIGVVITGSFVGACISISIIALVLHLLSSDGSPSREDLRWAMIAHLPLFVVGAVGIFISRRALRKRKGQLGTIPTWREVAARYRSRRP